MITELTCTHFFDGEHLQGSKRVLLSDGIVQEIGNYSGSAQFHLLSPGLVDIQMNGFDDIDVARTDLEGLSSLGLKLEALGTTTWLATITTAPLNNLDSSLNVLEEAFSIGSVPGLGGVHVEGPFLGTSPGAHRPDWIIPFDAKWLKELPQSVRLMTVGAEQENCSEMITQLRRQGIAVSVGHSRPTYEQWEASRTAGASLVTHLFNGMSGIHHRDDGLALFALTDETAYVGLIADLVHVSPAALGLVFKTKEAGRICLVSDSVGWRTEWAQKRNIRVSDGAPRLSDGTLAGSSTPLSQCVRNVVDTKTASLEDALRSATSAPADAVGLNGVGRISVGQPADLVAFSDSLHVVRAWRRLVSLRG